MKPKNIFLEYTEALFFAILLALFIRAFIVQPYKIPSGSMLQTLQIGDFLMVTHYDYSIKIPFTNKEIFRTGDPKVADIVVFRYPRDLSLDYIKRVVGVPGDMVEVRDKQLYRNGAKVIESYIQHTDPYVQDSWRDQMPPRLVPDGHYFVMGDNRDGSSDSRDWGFVPRENIRGKARFIFWSWASLTDIRWSRIGTMLR